MGPKEQKIYHDDENLAGLRSQLREMFNRGAASCFTLLPRIIMIIYFITLFVWIYQAEGGLGLIDSSLFGWHALTMSLSVVFFTTEAILIYSSPMLYWFNETFSKK